MEGVDILEYKYENRYYKKHRRYQNGSAYVYYNKKNYLLKYVTLNNIKNPFFYAIPTLFDMNS